MPKLHSFANCHISIAVALLMTLTFPISGLAENTLPTDKECSKNKPEDNITKGWCAAIIRSKGNCLACHVIVAEPWPAALPPGGNIAPALVAMKQRFPDQAKLRAQIWDATSANPNSSMPPFGKHKLLSETELDNIVEFLYSI